MANTKGVYDAATIERAVRIAVDEGTTAARLATGISDPQIRRYVKKRGLRPFQPDRTRGGSQPLPSLDGQESREDDLTETGWSINLKSRTVKTFDELVKECGVDLADWTAERFRCRSYQVSVAPRAVRPEDGINPETGKPYGWTRTTADIETVTMYAVAASFKKKVHEIGAREAMAGILSEFRAGIARPPLVLVPPPKTGLMLELDIPDLHSGKYVFGKETGGANYDLKIALDTMRAAISSLLARSAHLTFEKLLLPLGSDLFNSDNLAGTTTRGTPQDNDGRITKVFGTTLRAFIAVIEYAIEVTRCPLDAPIIGGNHDTLLSYLFGEALAAYFHDHPLVTIDAGPTLRKYREWGKVMLMFAHGDKPQGGNKADRWAHLMATEQKAMWARTTYREAHVGHLHTKKVFVDEIGGVRVRMLPSLTATDAYHAGEGYVGNLRAAEAYWWHKDDGLIGQANYVVPDELPEAA